MRRKRYLCIILLSFTSALFGQTSPSHRIAFYNVENLFDCVKDTLLSDQAFTPEGTYHWTNVRLKKKQNDLAKVILALGEGNPPVVVGLCEVENDAVLRQLCLNSPLRRYKYRSIIYKGSDRRGINTALIYRSDLFTPISSTSIKVPLPKPYRKTRDILYAKGVLDQDTLHFFVCHFPSKRGGAKSVFSRKTVGERLRRAIDSLCIASDKIFLLGDFNEKPIASGFRPFMQDTVEYKSDAEKLNFVNLMEGKRKGGTYFFSSTWSWIDHIIVSESVINATEGWTLSPIDAYAFRAPFMLEYNSKYMDSIPFRTYRGPAYRGGVSDHLPVYCILKKNR